MLKLLIGAVYKWFTFSLTKRIIAKIGCFHFYCSSFAFIINLYSFLLFLLYKVNKLLPCLIFSFDQYSSIFLFWGSTHSLYFKKRSLVFSNDNLLTSMIFLALLGRHVYFLCFMLSFFSLHKELKPTFNARLLIFLLYVFVWVFWIFWRALAVLFNSSTRNACFCLNSGKLFNPICQYCPKGFRLD